MPIRITVRRVIGFGFALLVACFEGFADVFADFVADFFAFLAMVTPEI